MTDLGRSVEEKDPVRPRAQGIGRKLSWCGPVSSELEI